MHQGLPWTREAWITPETALDTAQEGLGVEIICQIIKGLVGLSVPSSGHLVQCSICSPRLGTVSHLFFKIPHPSITSS